MGLLNAYDDEDDDPYSAYSPEPPVTEGPLDVPATPPPPNTAGGPLSFLLNPAFWNAQPKGGGGGGGIGGGGGSPFPMFSFKPVPKFDAPDFVRPTVEDAMNEPGYQFRLKGGADALERSAAAKGVLRTGGTLKDILDYGQNFASQEYGNVFNRALGEYDRKYVGAKDEFAPLLAQWSMLSNAEIQRVLAAYARDTGLLLKGGGGGGGYSFIDDEPPLDF
jgi:hypothetical protein